MGSNQFQREYIEYLQKKNTELLNKLNHIKENYENKILLREINKYYLMNTLEEVLKICTVIPQEIDLFFDKMTEAMSTFKNILLRKSEMVQLMEKISKSLNSIDNFSTNSMAVCDSGLLKDISEATTSKKAGIVKVSPMINGHIISTEPRIYLSRVPRVFTPVRRNESQLSPIIEESPEMSSDASNLGSQIFREIRIPLERINLNKISYISEESPKSRFKGPKTWKKSLSSAKQQSDTQRNTVFLESNENINKKLSIEGGVEIPQQEENNDPLEGPSWLYGENSGYDFSSSRFMEYKRRKHRFATVFDNDEDCCIYLEDNYKKSLKKDPNEFYENHQRIYNEEEDFKEGRGKVREDLIGESFSSDCDENYLPYKRRRKNSKKKRSKESGNKDDLNTDFNKETTTPFAKKKKIPGTPAYAESFVKESDEKISAEKLRKCNKSSKKLSIESPRERVSNELSFEKTLRRRSNHITPGARLNKKNKYQRKKNPLKESLKNRSLVESDDHIIVDENFHKKSKTSEKNKSKKSLTRTPTVLPQESEGRKKRKAAPSFKLVEPNLATKLRRN